MITSIKQYGEIRTGTNYLRALIQRNYPDIQVLSYILGYKHAPPAPFDRIWQDSQVESDPHFNFVSEATFAHKCAANRPKDLTQREELQKFAPQIARSYESGSLGFLVTIKDPYAWVVSAARFNGWIRGDEQLSEWSNDLMREACLGYNRNYRDWLTFIQAQQPRARLVRYEDLLTDPEQELEEIANQFGWPRTVNFEPVAAVIEPTQWDHLPINEAAENFSPAYYFEEKYLQQLPTKQLQQINELMDWDMLREPGYTRR